VKMVCIECWIPVLGLLFHFIAQLWAKFRGKEAPKYVPPTCPVSGLAAPAGLPADHPPVAPVSRPEASTKESDPTAPTPVAAAS